MNKLAYLVSVAICTALSSFAWAADKEAATDSSQVATAIFAGGCFWCIESDYEKLEGVLSAESGYTGGSAETAKYKLVGKNNTGHYEAVQVTYDPQIVSYAELVEHLWRNIDPTDASGQFCDKGSSYLSAIFYATEEEQKIVQESLAELQKTKPFEEKIVTAIEPAKPFYTAEKYHQDYYKKNPIRYNYYRRGCGRDKRLAQLWGEKK